MCGLRLPLLITLLLGSLSYATPTARILEGQKDDTRNLLSFTAAITAEDGTIICTATAVNDNWLLTAAHCSITEGMEVHVGSVSPQDTPVRVSKIVPHPKFSRKTGKHDIAVIAVEGSLDAAHVHLFFGKKVSSTYPAVAAGYGQDNDKRSGVLNQVMLKLASTKACSKALKKAFYTVPSGFKSKYFVCAGKDSLTCTGDSGGPLLLPGITPDRYVQVGVLSSGGDCGEKDVPNVYTSVTGHLKWIVQTISGPVSVVGKVLGGSEE